MTSDSPPQPDPVSNPSADDKVLAAAAYDERQHRGGGAPAESAPGAVDGNTRNLLRLLRVAHAGNGAAPATPADSDPLAETGLFTGDHAPSAAAAPVSAAAHQHDHSIGRFEIRTPLGAGAFGIVWRAWDPQLKRDVALKVPRLEALLSGDLRQRFLREAEAAARIDHPNVVPVFEAAEADGLCYIASACCPGPNLAEWIQQHDGPVPVRTAAEIVAALADAAHAGHTEGILHRDIKPSNVMLVPRTNPAGPAGSLPFIPRLTDFGLAKLLDQQLSATGSSTVIGTPLYMAPEQVAARDNELCPATDVFALGAILYELLTGQPPFAGATVLEVIGRRAGGRAGKSPQATAGDPARAGDHLPALFAEGAGAALRDSQRTGR